MTRSPRTFGKQLLVPLDANERSERAADLAGHLAGLTDARITLASVVVGDEEREPRQRYIDAMRSAVGMDVVSRTVVLAGVRVGRELAVEVDDETSTVMHTSATIAPHAGHFGSVAEDLIRASSRPMILIGPHALASIRGIRRVLVALDGSAGAERAVPVGCELAAMLEVPIWIVTVTTPTALEAAGLVGDVSESGYVRRAAKDACAASEAGYEVLHNIDPVEGILDFANEYDLIVLTTHGRSGLTRLLAGSVAIGVVRGALRPVVVVPPSFGTDPGPGKDQT